MAGRFKNKRIPKAELILMKVFEHFIPDILTAAKKNNFSIPEDIKCGFEKCVKVKIQNVASYYFSISDKAALTAKDVPNIMPPWKVFWMEYTLPSLIRQEGEITNKKFNERFHFGAMFFSEPGDNDVLHLKCFASIYHMDFTKVALFHSITGVSKAGRIVDMTGQNLENPQMQIKPLPLNDSSFYSDGTIENQCLLMSAAIQPCFLAICFCHCKNTIIQKNIVDEALVRSRVRKGHLFVDRFYTLEISAIKKILKQSAFSSGEGFTNSIHICRGHFKDFSDKGLFGKYKGLYWWDMQTRGSKELGIVRKDYSLDNTLKISD